MANSPVLPHIKINTLILNLRKKTPLINDLCSISADCLSFGIGVSIRRDRAGSVHPVVNEWIQRNLSNSLTDALFCPRHLTNVSGKDSACRRWTRRRLPREGRWKKQVPAQRPAAVPVRAPTLRPPPPSLRRRPFRGAMPTCSPPTHLSTHPWHWQQIPSTNQRIQPFTSQKDSETARGKGRFIILYIFIIYFHGPQDGLDQCRDSPLFLSLCPWHLSASGSIAWTSASLQNQACSRSSNRHLNINQSSLAIAYPFSFSLSHFHTQTVSIRDWTRMSCHWCPKWKGLPYCPRSRQTMERHLQSRHKTTAQPVHSIYLSLSVRPEVLKEKS